MKKTCFAMLEVGTGTAEEIHSAIDNVLSKAVRPIPPDAHLVDIDRGYVIQSEDGVHLPVGVALKFRWDELI